MSRHLTPSKICLLELVVLYHSGNVPQSACVPFLSFIASQLPRTPFEAGTLISDSPPPLPTTLKDLEGTLAPLQSRIPGRTLYDLLLVLLWEIQDFNAFQVALTAQITHLLTPSRGEEPPPGRSGKLTFSVTSPIGRYLRKCRVEFERLQFDDAYQLWEAFLVFRLPSKVSWGTRNRRSLDPSVSFAADVSDTLDKHVDAAAAALRDHLDKHQQAYEGAPASQDDVEGLIHFQLQQLQQFGNRIPHEMREQLRTMVQKGTSTPCDTHFVNFFDAWRSGNYAAAIENLHRYFDYTMEAHLMENGIKTHHQYALLHLAVLHADFGCYAEAISAMNECISTARENQDARCLHFSLSWLSHLRKAFPGLSELEHGGLGADLSSNEADTIHFLQQKATEPGQRDVPAFSGSLLAETELTLRTGGSVTKAIESSYQAGHLNRQYDIHSMAASQIRLHGSIFARLGQAPLAEQHCGIVRHIYGNIATSNDILSSVCQHAYMLALSGRYEDALALLSNANPSAQETLRLDQLWLGFNAMVRLKRALHRNELIAAEHLVRQLRPLRKLAEPGVVFETQTLELDLLIRQGKLSTAFDRIEALISEAEKDSSGSDIAHRIRLLCLKASVWAKAGKPARAFSTALRAASSAHRAMILPAMWTAVGALCTIFVDLGDFEGAKTLLEAIMPQALEGGNEYLVASLYSTLTDAYVGLAGQADAAKGKEREQNLNHANVYLERAKEAYAKMEDLNGTLDCLAKKAAVFAWRGEEALEEEMRALFEHTVEEASKREEEMLGRDV